MYKNKLMSQGLLKLLKEVQHLSTDELKVLLDEINRQIEHERLDKVRLTLQKFRGKGKDVWQQDAQDYINEMRKHDRF